MSRRFTLLLLMTILATGLCRGQAFIKTSDLFSRPGSPGALDINQSSSVDTLLSRYIIAKKNIRTSDGKQAIQGIRIQIYQSSVRTAREDANKVMLKFLNDHGDMKAYVLYQDPGWYKVRIGNYRSLAEAYSDLMMIKKEYPSAYAVWDNIPFPDQTR